MNPPRPIIASRRTFLATAGLASAYLAASPVKTLAAAPARRRFSVSLLSASPEVFDLISWRLWDPLVLAVGIPDIRAQAARECDLLLVTDRLGEHRQAAKAQPAGAYEEGTRGVTGTSLADVLTALPGARGVIAVQPAALGEPLSEAVAKRCGVAFKQWHPETPSSSHLTDHPLNALLRSLGRRPDHAHVTFDWHPEVTAPPASVVTRLASGAPDIVLQGRACFIASNLFSDLAAYGRHPDYWSHEATLAALLANLVRTALGETPATVSNRQAYDEARMAFYGYAFARKFVTDLQALKQNSQSPEGPLAAADDLVARAADRLLAGDVAAMRGGLREAGEHLIAIRQSLTPVKPYFVRGWHGGLLTNRKVGSEIVGYAEWGWPSFSMRWAEDRLRAAETQKTPTVNQVCGQTWDVIASFGLTELNRWKKASAAGLVETVKGMYSDAYLEVLGTESNLRQFEYGIKALALMGGESHTFALAYDDFALHPQLPQILRGYGFKRAVLRCGNPGVVVGVDKETLLWRGLDGALIPAVPKYRSVPVAIIGSGPTGGPNGGVNTMARTLVAAEKAGFRTVLAGGIQDHTMNMHGEYEWEAFNAMAHVQASPVTFAGYFAAVPPPNEARYFTADEMVGRPWAWCGFGSLNQMAREDRQLERLLVNAEKFATLASASGRPYPADLFEQAWKNLLSSQDHFVYGCGGAQNPEGYHVGGLEEPFMPDYPGPRTPISTEASGRAWKTQVEDVAREELDGALHHLLIREARPTATAETQVVVYNPHNWDRTGEVQCWLHGLAAPGLAVTDGEREWPATVLERHQDAGGERLLLSFQASAPSLGYRAYAIQPRAATAAPPARPADAPPVLENRYLRAVFDSQTGGLTSLVEKSGGVELLRQGEQACFLCTYPPVDTAKATARIEWERADPVASSLRISGQLGRSSYQLRVLLAHDSPVLELQLDIDYGRGAIFGYKGQPGTLLRYVLPFAAGAVRRLNLPFGVYESKTDSPVALDFAELAYTDHGVALLNDGVPGLHFAQDDVAILISDGFPPLRGVHHYRFGLLPHRGDWRAARVPWRAWDFQQPLAAKSLPAVGFSLPFSRSYLRTSDNAVLSGLHLHEGKPRARLYETTGAALAVESTWHIPWTNPTLTTLDGRDPQPAAHTGATVRFELPAWGIVTLAGQAMKGGQS